MPLPRARAFSLHRHSLFIIILFTTICPASASAGEELRIGGTGGALAVMRKIASAFQRDNPGTAVTILPSLGSSGGIKAVLAGKLDLGLSSRPLDAGEQGAVAREFGRTPFVFVVRRNNPASGFKLAEIENIYSGRVGNWPDGGRIRVVLRPSAEYDTTLLKSMSPEMDRAVTEALQREGMIVAITDQDSADAIEKIPGAVGTVTLGQLVSEDRPFKVLSLDGVRPGADALASGAYPYFKAYYLIMRPDAPRAAREFRDFLFSARGSGILSRCGYRVVR